MVRNKEVLNILKGYLKENGYDGLYHSELECGCFIDDLIPCNSYFGECRPGFKQKIKTEEFGECLGIGPKKKACRK